MFTFQDDGGDGLLCSFENKAFSAFTFCISSPISTRFLPHLILLLSYFPVACLLVFSDPVWQTIWLQLSVNCWETNSAELSSKIRTLPSSVSHWMAIRSPVLPAKDVRLPSGCISGWPTELTPEERFWVFWCLGHGSSMLPCYHWLVTSVPAYSSPSRGLSSPLRPLSPICLTYYSTNNGKFITNNDQARLGAKGKFMKVGHWGKDPKEWCMIVTSNVNI